jgi:hypothetical protein
MDIHELSREQLMELKKKLLERIKLIDEALRKKTYTDD